MGLERASSQGSALASSLEKELIELELIWQSEEVIPTRIHSNKCGFDFVPVVRQGHITGRFRQSQEDIRGEEDNVEEKYVCKCMYGYKCVYSLTKTYLLMI